MDMTSCGCALLPEQPLPKEQSYAFLQLIRVGDVDEMLRQLEVEPELVHARSRTLKTSLMLAAMHKDSDRALRMMDILFARGAYLGSLDVNRHQVLFLACRFGTDRSVIDKLLDWNSQRGGTKFTWSDCDFRGRSALVWVSQTGNTPVATLLLDHIDIKRFAKYNHPFKVLKVAIDSGDHQHALEIAKHEKISSSFKDPELTRYKGSGADSPFTISTCVVAAMDFGMLDMVQVLYLLNERRVSRAVWYKIHEMYRDGVDVLAAVPPILVGIGLRFSDMWRWRQIRDVCLARYGRSQDDAADTLKLLPGDVFRRVIAFIVPPLFSHPSVFEPGWCGCLEVFEGCRQHDRYMPTRSDYDRLFNPN